jgi:hypothetical protein
MSDDDSESSRIDLIDIMDGFISKILAIRKTLLSVSISGFVLAPFSIGISIFLFTHPHFFRVLQGEYEFGLALSILLTIIISVSVVWMIMGIRQHKILKSWDKKYKEFLKQKEEIDKKIASQYGLDQD